MKTNYLTNEKEVISILFLGKVFQIITYQLSQGVSFTFWDSITSVFIQLSIFLLFSVFIMKVNKKAQGSILSLSYHKHPWLAKVSLGIMLLLLLFQLAFTSDTFVNFITQTIYHPKDFFPLLIILFVLIGYFLSSGFPSLAKSSVVVSVLFYVFLALITLILLPRINLDYFSLQSATSVGDILGSGIFSLFSSMDFVLLLFFLPKVSNGKNIYYTFYIKSSLVTLLLSFLLQLTMGSLSKNQTYPFYALSITSNLSIFQRLDGLFIIIWILISTIKVAAFSFCILDLCKALFNNRSYHYPLFLPVLFIAITLTFRWISPSQSSIQLLSICTFLYFFLYFLLSVWVNKQGGLHHEMD